MSSNFEKLSGVQGLVVEVMNVSRHHRIPGTETRENVAVHSFSVAMLSWRIHELLGLNLDQAKIFKYAMVHDFSERGLPRDTSSYASPMERAIKEEREQRERAAIATEFEDFQDMTSTMEAYELRADPESRFVYIVDKMQAIILGVMDNWKPYYEGGITEEQYTAKAAIWLEICLPEMREVFMEVVELGRQTGYGDLAPYDGQGRFDFEAEVVVLGPDI